LFNRRDFPLSFIAVHRRSSPANFLYSSDEPSTEPRIVTCPWLAEVPIFFFLNISFAQPQTRCSPEQEMGALSGFVQILKEKRWPRRTRRPAARAREEKRGKPRAIPAYGPQSCVARLGFRAAAHSALGSGSGRRSKRAGPRCFSTDPAIAFLRVASRQACAASPSRLPFLFPVVVSSEGKPLIRFCFASFPNSTYGFANPGRELKKESISDGQRWTTIKRNGQSLGRDSSRSVVQQHREVDFG